MGMVIVPTMRCNLRCTHCMDRHYKGVFMDPAVLRKILTEVVKRPMAGKGFTLTGGEPTAHPQVDVLLGIFREVGVTTTFKTNGTIEKGVSAIIENKDVVDNVGVSFDCADETQNDAVRGKGSFAFAVEGVERYVAADIPVHLCFTLHDANVQFVKKGFEMAHQLGARLVSFNIMHELDRTIKNGLTVTPKLIKWAIRKANRLADRYPYIELDASYEDDVSPQTSARWRRYCLVVVDNVYKDLTWYPNGDACMCCDLCDTDFPSHLYENDYNIALSDNLGNIMTDGLDAILDKKERNLAELKIRRRYAAAEGKLVNGRDNICTDCRFYHFHDNPPPGSAEYEAKQKGLKVISIKAATA